MQLNPRLKRLEGLVQEAARRLKAAADESRNLKAELDGLQAENERLSRDLKRFQGLAARHEKVKGKIERLIHKIEKAEGVA